MLQWEEVTRIVKDLFNNNTERVPTLDNIEKICQSICAFSNDISGSFKNGYIIIGAKENGKLQGIKADDASVNSIYSLKSKGGIFPHPQIDVQKFSLPDGDVIVIEVMPSEYTPVRYNGKIWVKLGNRRSVAFEAEEKKLVERRLKLAKSFDSQPSFYSLLDAIDITPIKDKYAPLAIKKGVKINNDNIKSFLESLRLYDSRYDRPTNGAILLFGKDVKSNYPGSFIRYAKFDGENKIAKVIRTTDINGSIFEILTQIDTFLENNYPEENTNIEVIRELLINALMHRDYQSNTPIQIYEFTNHLEILSPGGLFGKVSPENFPNINDYRNPIIAETLKILGNCKGIASGIINAQNKLNLEGEFELYFDWTLISGFKIIIKKKQKQEVFTESQLTHKNKLSKLNIHNTLDTHRNTITDTDTIPVNDKLEKVIIKDKSPLKLNRITQQIFKIIKKFPGSSAPFITEKTGKSLPTIKRHLADLKSREMIEFIGAPKNGGYFIK